MFLASSVAEPLPVFFSWETKPSRNLKAAPIAPKKDVPYKTENKYVFTNVLNLDQQYLTSLGKPNYLYFGRILRFI